VRTWRKTLYALIAAMGAVVLFGTRLFFYRSGYHMAECAPIGDSILADMVIFGLFWLTVILFVWSIMKGTIWDKVSTVLLLVLLGCAFLRSYLGVWFGDHRAFLEGVRARLAQDVDPKQLQQWAVGVLPDTPPKEGFPIHLPNGQTVNPERSPFGSSTILEDGSFFLSPGCLPTKMKAYFPATPVVMVRYDPNPAQKHVVLGYYGEPFGWFIASGSPNYSIDEGMQTLQWRDGLYLCIRAGR
jgi:hypothetical protein